MLLSVMSCEEENNIFYEKSLKLMKSNTFDNIVCNRIVSSLSLHTNFLKKIGFFKITISDIFYFFSKL